MQKASTDRRDETQQG